ncbi:hypothetical protein PGB90_003745 [Kerria lacca]
MFKITFLLIISFWFISFGDASPLFAEKETSSVKPGEWLSFACDVIGNWISNFILNISNLITNFVVKIITWFVNLNTKPNVKKVNGVILRLDFISLALIERYIEDEQAVSQYLIAKSVIHFWQQLHTMERIDAILMNVTEDLVINQLKNEPTQIMKLLLTNVEMKIREDPELYNGYSEYKSKVRLQFNSSSNHSKYTDLWRTNDKAINQFIDEPLVKRLLLNKQFFINSRKHDIVKTDPKAFERFILAYSILQLAKKSTEMCAYLQNIYDEVLTYVSDKMNDFNNLSDDVIDLFMKLSNDIDKNHTLKFELEKIKKIVEVDAEFSYSDDLEFLLLLK